MSQKLLGAAVRHPPDARVEVKKLSKHEQGTQGAQVADAEVIKDGRTSSEMEDAVRVDTSDSPAGNSTYYEKGGSRIYGDGQDHAQEEPVCYVLSLLFL